MRRFWALVLVIIFALPSLLSADEVTIFYGNGVRNARPIADHSRRKLEQVLLSDPRFQNLNLSVDLAYNQTDCIPGDIPGPDLGCIGDFLEAFLQMAGLTDTGGFWLLMSGLNTDPLDLSLFLELVEGMANSRPVMVSEGDLGKHVDLYHGEIGEGKRKVVLVAHSQGNIFGNQAYTYLNQGERKSFGMVSVATPARDVLGDNSVGARYVTLEEDPIHQIPFALDANLSNLEGGYAGEPAWSFHDFSEWYMSFKSTSQLKILDHILELIDSLADPGEIGEPVTPDTLVVLDDYFDRLLTVNPATGATHFLMTMSRDTLSGLAYDRVSRLLYSVDRVTNELVALDLKTPSERRIGVVGVPFIIDLTFGPQNKLFGMACGEFSACRLVEIDTTTGVGTPRPTVLFSAPITLVYDPDSEKMYTTRNGGSFGSLSELDPETGAESSFIDSGPKGVVHTADQPGSLEIFAIGREPFTGRINQVGTFDPRAPFFVPFTSTGRSTLSGIESISLDGIVVPSNQSPVIRFTSEGGRFSDSYPMTWIDEDPDSNALIRLFYSTDPSCLHPVVIEGGIPEDDTMDLYVWDLSSLPEGNYYLYASISDGNETTTTCNPNTITVDH